MTADFAQQFRERLGDPTPLLALAPMQDITDHAFLGLMEAYGGPDVYVTEYFRVYPGSCLIKSILKSVTENPTGRPVIAQMIGHEIPDLVRIARELQHYPVAAVDLNLGCPAPVVYRKCAGGGLLRDPRKIDAILGALREVVTVPLTVKMRLGFEAPDDFERILPSLARHLVDMVVVHGRTVKGMYRSTVRYDAIAQVVHTLSCPVLANGDIDSAAKAALVLKSTRARGLMIGRGAIRNPWLFEQIRQHLRGETPRQPSGREVLDYVRRLFEAVRPPSLREGAHVRKMKKYMNYLGVAVEPTGQFLHDIRRVNTEADFFGVCETHLDHDRLLPLKPYPLALKPGDVMATDTEGSALSPRPRAEGISPEPKDL